MEACFQYLLELWGVVLDGWRGGGGRHLTQVQKVLLACGGEKMRKMGESVWKQV